MQEDSRQKAVGSMQKAETETHYLICRARKNQGKIPIGVCHKRKCVCLVSKGGKLVCDYEAIIKVKKHAR